MIQHVVFFWVPLVFFYRPQICFHSSPLIFCLQSLIVSDVAQMWLNYTFSASVRQSDADRSEINKMLTKLNSRTFPLLGFQIGWRIWQSTVEHVCRIRRPRDCLYPLPRRTFCSQCILLLLPSTLSAATQTYRGIHPLQWCCSSQSSPSNKLTCGIITDGQKVRCGEYLMCSWDCYVKDELKIFLETVVFSD